MSAMEDMAVKFIQKLLPPETYAKIDEFIFNIANRLKETTDQLDRIENDVKVIKVKVCAADPAEAIMHDYIQQQALLLSDESAPFPPGSHG